MAPFQPTDISHSSPSPDFAEIQWLVTTIAYTPENYTIIYGKSQDLMNKTSTTIFSTPKISKSNQMYSNNIRGLDPNTTYFYQVISRNSIGTNFSGIGILVTPLPSKNLFCISYNKVLSYILHLVADFVVYINSSTTVFMVGEQASLVCTIKSPKVSGDLSIRWIRVDRTIPNNTNSTTVGPLYKSDNVTKFGLHFSSLFTSHGGEYTCQATLKSENVMYTVAATQNVIIIGNSIK